MQAMEVEDLSFAWSDARSLLSDVSFGLSPGFVGLVGANGAGKTTLARLMAGELQPTSGRVRFQGDSPSIVVCAQGVDELPSEVVALSEERGARRRFIGLFGLVPARVDHWSSLSPGERKRWQLAAALSVEPDVLIVDEPTNHLDAAARELVLSALARHRGIGILISHDRELLDALTTSTLRVENGTARLYAGSYSRAREQWEADRARRLEVRETQVRAQRKAQARLEREQRKLEAVRRNLSTKRRMKNPNDHDARSTLAKFRVERAEATISRAVSVQRGALERADCRVEEFVVDKTLGRSVFVDYEPAPKPRVLSLVKDEIVVGEHVLLRDVRIALGKREKVRLVGPNGCGMTTLIRALLDSSADDDRNC
jgi:ATPase subunit of ABC transporter with duplicated ATPase domains